MTRLTVFVLSILLSAGLCLAATNNVTANSVFEVESTGNAANGGCFDATLAGGTGVNHTYGGSQATTTYTATLSTSGAGSTTLSTSGTFSNTQLANCIQISAGTNFVAGWYTIAAFTDASN